MDHPNITGMLTAGIQRIKTNSILAPLLALTVIVGIMALAATAFFRDDPIIVYPLWLLFIGLVIFLMNRYMYWEKVDPKRLQSEDFQIAAERLRLIGDERDPRVITISADTLTANTAVQSSSRND